MKLKDFMSDIRRNNEFVDQGGSIALGAIECQREGIKTNSPAYFTKLFSRAQEISTFLGNHREEDVEKVIENAKWQRYLAKRYKEKNDKRKS